jgi:hypothetical protein
MHPPLKQDDAAALVGEGEGDGAPEDARANHDDIRLVVLLAPLEVAGRLLGIGYARHDCVGCGSVFVTSVVFGVRVNVSRAGGSRSAKFATVGQFE